MPLAAGTRLGPYEVVSHLGAGGMGEVYRARDTRLDRTVAIKVLPTQTAKDARRLERCRQEARAVSRLSHPHICTLHDVGEQDGTFFLVMEHVQGRTLAERLEEGALPLDELLRHGIQIAEALNAAHREGVVHRDLKPANVMLTREGVKLLDFGLARLKQSEPGPEGESPTASALTEEGVVLGTLPYMAPEQLEGRKADARTDIFALGTVLYEMATGKRPFLAGSRASLIAAILVSEPPPLSALKPLAPPALEWAVKRCLAKDPEDRWQSAADVAAQLRWILEGGSQTGPAVARRRRRGWVATAAALIVTAIVGGAVTTRGFLRREPPRFQRLTFRPGTVSGARFAPDGQTIVYSAAWQDQPYELFLTRPGGTDSRPLGLTDARILSLSSAGEMAFLFTPDRFFTPLGTLARAPLAGGAPRRMLEGVRSADWMPDGAELAVVRRVGTKDVVEFPVGHNIHEGPVIWSLRVSPGGDHVAFVQGPFSINGDVIVLDRSGRVVTVSKGWIAALGLAWSPQGDEVWFSGSRIGDAAALHAVSLSGKERVLARAPDPFVLRDVFRDGRALAEGVKVRTGLACLAPGEAEERELGWLDGSWVEDVSADGRLVLIFESIIGGGSKGGVYVRPTDGAPAVRLGDGRPEALSPDGEWVFATSRPEEGADWLLLPTGPGSPRTLDRGPIRTLVEAAWLADGKRIVLTGREEGATSRLYVLDVESGTLRRLSDEGVYLPEYAATADGRSVLLRLAGRFVLYPVDGGEPRPIPHLSADDSPLKLSPDNRFVYVRSGSQLPAKIDRVEIASGARTHWRTLSPRDPVGVMRIQPVLLLPDARSYCYSYTRVLADLFLVEGLR